MPGRFETYEDRSGNWRFRLKDSTGQVLAAGEAVETPEAARAGCELIRETAAGAEVVDLDAGSST